MPTPINTLVPLVAALLLVPNNAFAYLDPGSGSMIFQGIVAAIFGGLFVIKTYWHKILKALGLKKDPNNDHKV